MKKMFLFLALLMLSSCVQLTPAGASVHIIQEDQSAIVAACQPLGVVSVSSEDALRNNTAALAGDTAIIHHRDLGATSIVRGDIFRCLDESNTKQKPATTGTTIVEADAEQRRKSNLCLSKGGNWINGQCVISIE